MTDHANGRSEATPEPPATPKSAATLASPAVKIDARFDRDAMRRAGGFAWLLVRTSAHADPDRERRPDDRRGPLNVAAVLDRSGSMAGAKLDHTKRALKLLAR